MNWLAAISIITAASCAAAPDQPKAGTPPASTPSHSVQRAPSSDEPAPSTPSGRMRSLDVEAADPEDRGVIPEGQNASRRIVMRNVLDVPVTVEILTTSCGCTEARWSSQTILPGESASLFISTRVATGFGLQTQTAVFRAQWQEAGESRAERGMCTLTFTSERQVVVRPELAVVTGVQGTPSHVDIFVRPTVDRSLPPPTPHTTLPGWSVTLVRPGTDPDPTWHFRASGPTGSAGYSDGDITLWSASERVGEVRVPVHLRSLSAWVAEPSSALLTTSQPEVRLHLRSRVAAPTTPSRVVSPGGHEWLEAELVDSALVVVRIRPGAAPPKEGAGADVLVVDEAGQVLVSLPTALMPTR